MLKFFYKNDGAITVFLAMILVPIITISSLFVDASRISMADSVLDSAADLTLESVLANYDAELNDFYGLLASAQDVDDFYDKANGFLVDQMTSNGLTATEANTIIQQIYSSLAGDEQADLLQLALEENSGNVVSAVDNANLANATMIKKSISDFMKYRAPINLTADIVNKFKKVGKASEDNKKNTELVDKKEEFYESQSELLKKAFEIFELREEYTDLFTADSNDITAYLDNMKLALPSYKEKYKKIHNQLFMDVYNAEDTDAFSLKTILKYEDITDEKDTPFDADNKATYWDITGLEYDLELAMETYNSTKSWLGQISFVEWSNKCYDLQYWVQNLDAMYSKYSENLFDELAEDANKVVKYIVKLENALDNTDVVLSDATQKEIDDTLKEAKDEYDKVWHKDASFVYYRIGEKIQACSSVSKVLTSKGNIDSVTSFISEELGGFDKCLEDAKKKADKIAKECGTLISLAKDYEEKLGAWEQKANETDTDLGKRDVQEINDNSKDNEELIKAVSENKVQEMKTRYENISTFLDGVLKDIDKFKYGKDELADIESSKDMKKAVTFEDREISMYTSTLEHNSELAFDKNYSEPNPLAINTLNENNNPDIKSKPTNFDKWLTAKFGKLTDEERKNVGKNKNKYKKLRTQGEDEANKEQKGNSTSGEDLTKKMNADERPSNGAGKGDDPNGSGDSPLDKANSLLEQFVTSFTFKNNMERLYGLDYIMSMFSYDTYEYEGMYKSVYETVSGKSHLTYAGTKPTTAAEAIKFHESMKKQWDEKKSDIKFTYGKTLTNKVIDATYNRMYGGEVEYILYGGSISSNKAKAYGSIYLIRYAMNCAPMFMKYWNEEVVTAPARAISLATSGIVPEMLVRIVIILALNAFESSLDLSLIKQGLPVPFVKTTENLYLDLDGDIIDEGKCKMDPPTGTAKVPEEGEDLFAFYYSDYLSFFLFTKMLGNQESSIYLRIADVIQFNMRDLVGEQKYLLKDAVTYFQLNATAEIPPLMMKLPINNTEEKWEDKMDDKYKIKVAEVRGY